MKTGFASRYKGMRPASAMLAIVAMGASVAAYAQGAGRTVWAGTYSADQATRGKAAYDGSCAVCHGASLAGGDSAPALAGGAFLNNWNGTSAAELFDRIHTTMPATNPGSLSIAQVADIEAYMFQANGFPAGPIALSGDAATLSTIRIVAIKPAG